MIFAMDRWRLFLLSDSARANQLIGGQCTVDHAETPECPGGAPDYVRQSAKDSIRQQNDAEWRIEAQHRDGNPVVCGLASGLG